MWAFAMWGDVIRADYMQGTSLKFATEEEAVRFCSKQGQSAVRQSLVSDPSAILPSSLHDLEEDPG